MDTKKRKKKYREKKEVNNKLIKNRIIRDTGTLFEKEEEDYYKPKIVSNFWNNNCIEYEISCDKNRNFLIELNLT